MKKAKTRKLKTSAKPSKAAPQAAFQGALEELFGLLRYVDYARLPEHIRTAPKFLVARLDGLQIRMDADKNHGRGHVHIKYKKEGHAASYAIDDGSRLAGKLPTYYDRTVQSWIIKNQTELRSLWESAQRGVLDKVILLTFRTTVYD
jgi:Domain of unknown function (DUF4160)